jgi:hypothetical protein
MTSPLPIAVAAACNRSHYGILIFGDVRGISN